MARYRWSNCWRCGSYLYKDFKLIASGYNLSMIYKAKHSVSLLCSAIVDRGCVATEVSTSTAILLGVSGAISC
jgi:predicted nucleic-acid-binding Zn-ribbon protein